MPRRLVSPELEARIRGARQIVVAAERELDAALKKVKVTERAQKTMISNVLQSAFKELATAKKMLEQLVDPD